MSAFQTFRRVAAMLAGAALLSACGGGIAISWGDDDFFVRDLPFAHIAVRDSWPSGTYVARTQVEWAQVWAQRTSPASSDPVPEVNFALHMVAGISAGSGPDSCWSLRIVNVTEFLDEVRLDYRISQATGVECVQGLVPLVDFVEIPLTGKPVSFVAIAG